MSEGTLEGPRIKARIAMPGGDWYRPGADGFGRPDVRVQFITDDDAVILLHYNGLAIRDTYGDWDRRPLDGTSPRMIYICRARQ